MPRGENENSKKNLAKGHRFTADTAREASKKAAETRKAYSSAREALKDYMTDDKYRELMEALHKRGKAGNLTAIDMILSIPTQLTTASLQPRMPKKRKAAL